MSRRSGFAAAPLCSTCSAAPFLELLVAGLGLPAQSGRYLSALLWLDQGLAFWLFGTMTSTMLVFAGRRELGNDALTAEALGGSFELQSQLRASTTVQLSFPERACAHR